MHIFNTIIPFPLSYAKFDSHKITFVDIPTTLEFTTTYPPTHPLAFSPRSRVQLKSVVDTCLKLSPKGSCLKGPHGPIGSWDVSRVTDMSRMFARAKFFDSDISKWDVSRVMDMSSMFMDTKSFNVQLCGDAWVNSKATKKQMFSGAVISRRRAICPPTPSLDSRTTAGVLETMLKSVYVGRSELRSAVEECLELLYKGDCSEGPHGPISEWDVSK